MSTPRQVASAVIDNAPNVAPTALRGPLLRQAFRLLARPGCPETRHTLEQILEATGTGTVPAAQYLHELRRAA